MKSILITGNNFFSLNT